MGGLGTRLVKSVNSDRSQLAVSVEEFRFDIVGSGRRESLLQYTYFDDPTRTPGRGGSGGKKKRRRTPCEYQLTIKTGDLVLSVKKLKAGRCAQSSRRRIMIWFWSPMAAGGGQLERASSSSFFPKFRTPSAVFSLLEAEPSVS